MLFVNFQLGPETAKFRGAEVLLRGGGLNVRGKRLEARTERPNLFFLVLSHLVRVQGWQSLPNPKKRYTGVKICRAVRLNEATICC